MRSRILAVLAISMILAGCSKDSSDDNVVPGTNNLLKKFVLLDPTQSAPNDTLVTSTYIYDAQNRCTGINSVEYSGGSTLSVTNFYNGSGTVIQNRKINYPGGEYDWEYFTYNSAGQMIGDSIVSNVTNTFVYKYQLSGNNYLMTLRIGADPFLKATYQQTRDAAGNIIAEKDSSFHYDMPAGTYFFYSTSDLTESYDGHPSPFYDLYPKRLVMLEYENASLDDFYISYSIPQKYNITEEQRTDPLPSGIGTYHNRYTYQYNANGYPAVLNFTDLENGDVAKGLYFY